MKIEMGESLCYSWLRHVKRCQVVQTNWKVSPKWPLKHEGKLQALMDASDKHFREKYGYKIYKKSSSLSQLIRQGECDALGFCLESGKSKAYALDVAFHEKSLAYGNGNQDTVKAIIKKCLRSAMCVYGFLDAEAPEIIFASPKVGPTLLAMLKPCVADTNEILHDLGFDCNVQIIANDDFNSLVLRPVLDISSEVADTSELFLRSYQMYQMFGKTKQPASATTRRPASASSVPAGEMRIGELVQLKLRPLLEDGKVTPEEVDALQTLEGSKDRFGLSYPLLVPAGGEYTPKRYYKAPLTIYGKSYKLTSQWIENQHRERVLRWIADHE